MIDGVSLVVAQTAYLHEVENFRVWLVCGHTSSGHYGIPPVTTRRSLLRVSSNRAAQAERRLQAKVFEQPANM